MGSAALGTHYCRSVLLCSRKCQSQQGHNGKQSGQASWRKVEYMQWMIFTMLTEEAAQKLVEKVSVSELRQPRSWHLLLFVRLLTVKDKRGFLLHNVLQSRWKFLYYVFLNDWLDKWKMFFKLQTCYQRSNLSAPSG
ncbi:uncharacterized protein LOC132059714 isoform X2 [Lycium ferocissimum]|uniref:uncharacterized protein LOC132059714 isoform X2 n=1 Tax=Lycium ferocissimum TaxID=112874 RepID=UPI002814EA43|nr:uncharacterized protein LOC132059714 isoform X2 [Lycium ferocissimum]